MFDDLINRKNILYGIGKGSNDDETYQYTLFYSDFNAYQFNHFNTFNEKSKYKVYIAFDFVFILFS